MNLSREDAYGVFGLPVGAPIEDVIKEYKYLALEWFPDNHSYSKISTDHFQRISQALLILYFVDSPYQLNDFSRMMSIDEMLLLFQFIFFGSEDMSFDEMFDEVEGDEAKHELVDFLQEDLDSDSDIERYAEALDNLPSDKKEQRTSSENVTEQEAVRNAEELIQGEEREKKKSQKRKAQKKRRKERKKLEKSEQQKKEAEVNAKEKSTKVSEAKVTNEPSSSDSEENLDTESAFVSEIAKKKIGQKIPLKKDSKDNSDSHLVCEPLPRTARVKQCAGEAYRMAARGHFEEAIQLYTEAIKLEQKDPRLFSNRAFCFEKMEIYDRALRDSDKTIQLEPNSVKGHFRRGTVLKHMKRFVEAEKCFLNVLQLCPGSEEALKELVLVRMCNLSALNGITIEEAEEALRIHGSPEAAIEALLKENEGVSGIQRKMEEVFLSDDEDGFLTDNQLAESASAMQRYSQMHSQTQGATAYDIKLDPSNPEKLASIWVGNVQAEVTEHVLISLFSKYGQISSIRLMTDKFCAFINYSQPASAGMAMKALQSFDLCGSNLLIRFPNTVAHTSATAPKPLGAPSNDECVFWRSTGCKYGENCRFRHIKKNRGIDKDKKK